MLNNVTEFALLKMTSPVKFLNVFFFHLYSPPELVVVFWSSAGTCDSTATRRQLNQNVQLSVACNRSRNQKPAAAKGEQLRNVFLAAKRNLAEARVCLACESTSRRKLKS